MIAYYQCLQENLDVIDVDSLNGSQKKVEEINDRWTLTYSQATMMLLKN